jgi:DNA polymerase
MNKQMKDLFKEWCDCTRCSLHETATNHVVYEEPVDYQREKGIDVLFIGEAPGLSEDLCGRPFIGPAGRVLRAMISEMQAIDFGNGSVPFSYGITNIIACMPRVEGEPSKFRAPTQIEADACNKRVQKIVDIRKPAVIVLLGKIAQAYAPVTEIPTINLYHPSYILRKGGESSKEYTKTAATLQKFLALHLCFDD